ncbi:DUF536 domain-containing protein, partial [Enterococcus faecium]
NQQIEKLQEQLQLAYTEDPEEEVLTSVNKENNNAITTEKKWWIFW